MNLTPASRQLLVSKCTDPYLPDGKMKSGIIVEPGFKYVTLTPMIVVAGNPESPSPFAKTGVVVYVKFGDEEGFVSDGGKVMAFIHENLVRGWIDSDDHNSTPLDTTVLDLMDAVRKLNSPRVAVPNGRQLVEQ